MLYSLEIIAFKSNCMTGVINKEGYIVTSDIFVTKATFIQFEISTSCQQQSTCFG